MKMVGLFLGGLYLFVPRELYAMHISEGILSLNWALLWWAIAILTLGLALRRLNFYLKEDPQRKAVFAFVTAFVFLVSVIPIPVPFAGTCSHPVGVAAGVFLLGLSGSIVAGFIVLLLQALLLAHGGLSSLGANTVAMAVVGSLSAYLVILIFSRAFIPLYMKAFLSGVIADWATYGVTALQLALALSEGEPWGSLWVKILLAFTPTQVPLGLLEGVITAGVVTAIAKRRSNLLITEVLKFQEGVTK
ncbi:MAG: energy-coupling factor ABC transporter permease [Caldimicrobium sp.]|nr:energy-coupling factor ABC transporter permease [Caldimicrobium sp.]